jgi:UDP-N-acetylglucosamine--N-acetylmuramyl-(pentapeptide) pyrophosphoryl-undecaprenol N-acetylglucosamine transferase
MKKLIIAGGGTGGHVLPGVAIADEWKAIFGADSVVRFVGAHGGIEEKLVPKAGYPLDLLSIGSLKRVSWSQRLKTLFQLPFSVVRSMAILLRERPTAVLGVGGYASGPFLLASALLSPFLGIRTAILEFNVVPGFTNRWLGRFVQKVFLAFGSEGAGFSTRKTQVIGTPVRSALRPLPPARTVPFTVFVFGGSQGAFGINSLVLGALEHLGEWKGKIHFIHQTGEKDFDRVRDGHRQAGTQARVERFVYDMPAAYAEASLLICRAGASTLSEIATVRRAAILIPLPTAADDHQRRNAEVFRDQDGAWLVPQITTTPQELAKLIVSLASNPARLHEVEANAGSFHRPGSARAAIQALVEIDPGSHPA